MRLYDYDDDDDNDNIIITIIGNNIILSYLAGTTIGVSRGTVGLVSVFGRRFGDVSCEGRGALVGSD